MQALGFENHTHQILMKEGIMHENNQNKKAGSGMQAGHSEGSYVLIDRFTVPRDSQQEFIERMEYNRSFIRELPGFLRDAVYQRFDEDGKLTLITVAVWENEQVLSEAREAVQAQYKSEDFDPAALLERLNITSDRGIYTLFSQNRAAL